MGSVRDDLLQRSAQHGFTLSRVESVVSTDLAAQVRVIRSAYEAIDDHGVPVVKRFVEWPFRISIASRPSTCSSGPDLPSKQCTAATSANR